MKIFSILVVLFAFGASVFSQNLETPVKNMPLTSTVDPKQKDADFRIWKNLIKTYVTFRQAARASLKDLQSVSDFAWAAQKQLTAIERTSQRIAYVIDNIEDFRTDDPIQMVKDAERKIFRQTDQVIYYDIPNIRQKNEELASARDDVANRAATRISQLAGLSTSLYKGFQKKFFRTAAMSDLEDKTTKSKVPDADVQAHTLAVTTAAKGLAASDLNNQTIETQGAQLTGVLSNASDNGEVNPLHQAEMNKENQRNGLVLSIQSNQNLNLVTQNASMLLVTKAKNLEQIINQKSAMLAFMEAFSTEANKQRGLRAGD